MHALRSCRASRQRPSSSSSSSSSLPSSLSALVVSRRPVSTGDASDQLRHLMRNVPQPVAVACTRIAGPDPRYHGATLSSFTSLTLHPHPLVAFSLRLPSRLADHLRPLPAAPAAPAETSPGKRLSISLLSLPHSTIATALSKPGHDASSLLAPSAFAPDPGTESVPAVQGCIGTLQCQVVSSTPLRDMVPTDPADEQVWLDEETLGGGLAPLSTHDIPLSTEPSHTNPHPNPSPHPDPHSLTGDEVHGSELFICRVLAVHHGTGPNASSPLLYWRHKYTTVSTPES